MPQFLVAPLVLLFPALVLTAAASDALSFRIPNWISLALLVAFPLAAFATGMPLPTIGLGFGIGAAALIVGVILWMLRWVGGGDAKLFATAALWMGWPGLPYFAIGVTITGGVLALALMALRSPNLRAVVLLGPRWVGRLAEPGASIPYGIAIALGALIGFLQTPFAAALGL